MDARASRIFGGQHAAATTMLAHDPALRALLLGLLSAMASDAAHGSTHPWLQHDLTPPLQRVLPASALGEAGWQALTGQGRPADGVLLATCAPAALALPPCHAASAALEVCGGPACAPLVVVEVSCDSGSSCTAASFIGRMCTTLNAMPASVSLFSLEGDCMHQVGASHPMSTTALRGACLRGCACCGRSLGARCRC